MLFVFEPEGLEEKAMLAREHFARNGPSDAPPLPIGYDEREAIKGKGRMSTLVALYARSLETRDYDMEEHPSFEDYVRGVMASNKHGWSDIREDEQLTRRFPPRPLKGMGPGLMWAPVKRARREQVSKAA
jgi:hypothetical protein